MDRPIARGRSKRPKPGTKAYRIWAILDRQRQQNGAIDTREVYEVCCVELDMSRETVHSAIGRYKKHYRMTQ